MPLMYRYHVRTFRIYPLNRRRRHLLPSQAQQRLRLALGISLNRDNNSNNNSSRRPWPMNDDGNMKRRCGQGNNNNWFTNTTSEWPESQSYNNNRNNSNQNISPLQRDPLRHLSETEAPLTASNRRRPKRIITINLICINTNICLA